MTPKKSAKKSAPKPGRADVVAHQVVHDQVHPCLCGVWFSSPTDLQDHLDSLK